MTAPSLVMFYDNHCPLCCFEIEKLKRLDKRNVIIFIDLHDNEAMLSFPDINKPQALQVIHGYQDGKLVKGIEVTIAAWSLVGKKQWVKPLSWSLVLPVAKLLYRLFAKYRHTISRSLARIFGLKNPDCQTGGCNGKKL